MNLSTLPSNFTTMSAKQRMDWITNQPNAMALVKDLPAQDLIFTLQEIGLSDTHELLELITSEQAQNILDLCAWQGEHLDPDLLKPWLLALYEANPQKYLKHFMALDEELVSLLFHRYTQILDYSDEEGLPDTLHSYSITPDRKLLVIFREDLDADLSLLLKKTLEQLYNRHLSFAAGLLKTVRWDLPSHLEEESLRWRNNRLEDLGFPSPIRAKSILAYTPLETFQTPTSPLPSTLPSSTSYVLQKQVSSATSFQAILSKLPNEAQSSVLTSLFYTLHQVHFTLEKSIDLNSLQATIKQVLATCEIALDYLYENTHQDKELLLATYLPKSLFQIGNSLGIKLRQEFLKLQKQPAFALQTEQLKYFEAPIAEALTNLLHNHPFTSLKELTQTAKHLQEACLQGLLMGPQGINWTQPGLTHSVLFNTFIANRLLGYASPKEPLDENRLQQLFLLCKDNISINSILETLTPSAAAKEWGIASFKKAQQELLALKPGLLKPAFIETLFVRF